MMGDGAPGEQETKMSSGDSGIPQPPGASVLLSEEGGGCSETEFSSLSVKMSEEDQPSRIFLERHLPRRLMAPLRFCPREGGRSCPSRAPARTSVPACCPTLGDSERPPGSQNALPNPHRGAGLSLGHELALGGREAG